MAQLSEGRFKIFNGDLLEAVIAPPTLFSLFLWNWSHEVLEASHKSKFVLRSGSLEKH